MQIQITRTLIWVTNDARYYLATSACKLERQALSIWPFQIQRVRRRHYRPHGCATPPRYLFQRLKPNFTRESWNINVKHIEDACPSQRNEKVFPKQWSLRVHQSENKSRQLFMFLFGKEIWQQFVSQLIIVIPHICHGRHRRRPCKFFLAGVIFFRFNAKNWQFTV